MILRKLKIINRDEVVFPELNLYLMLSGFKNFTGKIKIF
jgi:hypothetical protein